MRRNGVPNTVPHFGRTRWLHVALACVTEDDWRWHTYDTIKRTDWPGDQDAFLHMCRLAPEVTLEPEAFGIQRAFGDQYLQIGKDGLAHRLAASTSTSSPSWRLTSLPASALGRP